ncbi:1-acyl-sn-glycerol-3-phosphate acyltransferase [Chlamydiifrater phoenicopteri]|uniref:1-acyl-sn-glycerol-3-phosphate acyltransferase n=1 Tax=Chlamydiifrater phoenicopteri TaxID=2681469 RepID=UPI001BCF0F5F|nr:1-acyl-sn-glycerol-3-phosphate acyltransferase [Chlamydiifrater phoenicopteri]
MSFLQSLDQALINKELPEDVYERAKMVYLSYVRETEDILHISETEAMFSKFLELLKADQKDPFQFPCFHKRIVSPINLESFGQQFFRPLIDIPHSCLLHSEVASKIIEQLSSGENVILLANHQVEADPQVMQIMLKTLFPERFLKEIIFLAGDRVTSDPIARPFSMGCNLLCIYSKRHIDSPPERREEKLRHNQKSMKVLKTLLSQGGKFIYVAPSGGRDRKDASGRLAPAPFHPDSIEMFRLLGKSCAVPTHFYPMALKTFDILPPPPVIEQNIGEQRSTKRSPVHFAFGEEVDLNSIISTPEVSDKRLLRELRANVVFGKVQSLYKEIADL